MNYEKVEEKDFVSLSSPFPWVRQKAINRLSNLKNEEIIVKLVDLIRKEKKEIINSRNRENSSMVLKSRTTISVKKVLLEMGPNVIPTLCQIAYDEANLLGGALVTDATLPITIEKELFDVLRSFDTLTLNFLTSQIKNKEGRFNKFKAQWLLFRIWPNKLFGDGLDYFARDMTNR